MPFSFFDNSVNNNAGTPGIFQSIAANRPAANALPLGSLFVDTTNNILQRTDGSAWITISQSSGGTITGGGTSGQLAKWSSATSLGDAVAGTDYVTPSALLNYLPLSGGTLTGTLNGTTFSGTSFIGQNFRASNAAGVDIQNASGQIVAVLGAGGSQGTTFNGQINGTAISLSGNITAASIIRSGGTSAQFLKADGSIDSNTYATTTQLGNYLPLSGGTLTGITNIQNTILRFNTASAQRGVMCTYNYVIGSGTDYSFGLFSEGELFFASGGSATKRLIIDNSGNTTITGSLSGTSASFSGIVDLASGATQTKFRWLGYNGAYSAIQSDVGFNSTFNGTYLVNNTNLGGNGQGNISVSSWILSLGQADALKIQRSPAGSYSFSDLFTIASTGQATFSNAVTASGFTASGPSAGLFTQNTAAGNGYALIAQGASGAARDIFIAGQVGFSNGFTVKYNGTNMIYSFLDGNVGIGTSSPSSSASIPLTLNATGTNIGSQVLFTNSYATGYLGLSADARGDIAFQVDSAGTGSDKGIKLNTNGNTTRLYVTNNGNIGYNTTTQFGGGVFVIGIANATTVPTANPTGGGVLYVESGALKYRGSSGTVTTIANA